MTADRWAGLERMLEGRCVRPGDAEYRRAREVWAARYNDRRPAAVVYAAGVADVRAAVRFAREHELRIVPRSGGHSFAGYSTGDGSIILDLSGLNEVRVEDPDTAVVGAGNRNIDIYERLVPRGLTVAAGGCVSVGIAGLTLGGGIGYLSRMYGLTCDELIEVELVTAEGELVRASEEENEDLHWACRGAGGGSFAVATSLKLRARPVPKVGLLRLRWGWEDAPQMVAAWQRFAPVAPAELFPYLRLENTPGAEVDGPQAIVFGAYTGPERALAPLLDELIDAVGSPPESREVRWKGWLEALTVGLEHPDDHLYTVCGRDRDPDWRIEYAVSSAFASEPISAEAIETLVGAIEAWRGGPTTAEHSFQGGAVEFEPLGGAVNSVPADATAFVHRNSHFLAQFAARWDRAHVTDPSPDEEWLRQTYAAMRPHLSRSSYQNYPDPELADWQDAYYGGNLPRLREIKSRWDPDDFFRFPQSIPPL